VTFPPNIPVPTEWRITVAAPSPGNDWSYKVPTGLWVRLLSGSATLTTSSTAAHRYPGTLVVDAQGVEVGELESSAVAANTTQRLVYTISFNWQVGGAAEVSPVTLFLSLPYFVLPPGYTLGSITPNLQSGDRYSPVELLLERWTSRPYFDAWAPSLRVR
jgi:hypothetical protein